jgi:zinc protease
MKKILAYVLIAVGILNISAYGSEKIPMDPAIRYGKLKNGLTYYIRHNEEPKNRASFYMAQNVGAILENDDQNGLAHFLEHMSFNGTEHFKGKGIIKFLEKHGVGFGGDINAYTAQDETVYNLSNVPTTKEGLIDSCLLVLHDWSNYLLLTDEEIDAERGVIREEWRTRRTSQFRIMAQQNKALFYGSKYAERDVIGSLDVINHHKYQTLRDFYHKWYRTDLQAIIIIGDFDVDEVEKSVKRIFSEIPAIENAAERKEYEIPDNKEPLYALATDKEATNYTTALMFKIKNTAPENKDKDYLKKRFIRSMCNDMLGARIQERMQQRNCPFMFAQASIGELVRTKDMAIIFTVHQEGAWEAALREAITIVKKVRDHGFTQAELDRAKKSILSMLENVYKMRDKTDNDTYARAYKGHFMNNSPIPGIKYNYKFAKDYLPQITLNDFQSVVQNFLTEGNMVILVSGPETNKEGIYPSKEEVLKVVNEVKNTKFEAYTDTYVDKPLLAEEPVAGKIIKRKNIKSNALKAVELKLSNGIRVLYRQSDIEKETITFDALSWGGISLLKDKQMADASVFDNFVGNYGLSDFSAVELNKKLTGKIVSIEPSIGGLSEGMSGSAAPKDLETMFKLLYLSFTKPRFDKKAYEAVHSRIEMGLENIKNDAKQAFNDSISVTMADHNPKVRLFNKEFFNEVSFEGIKKVYKERFANPADFIFCFSGNFEVEKLEAFIEKYVASLPTTKVKEKYFDNGVRPPKKDVNNHFVRKLETKKATVYVNFHKKYKYNQKNNIYAYIISKLLDKRYMEEIREKEGGTYGIGVRVNTQEDPYKEFQLTFKFDCDPENSDKLKKIALDEIQQMINGKIVKSDLEDIKKSILKSKKEAIETLGYWTSKLSDYAFDGNTGMSDYEYVKFIYSINPKTVAKKAKKFLKNAVKVEVIMSTK